MKSTFGTCHSAEFPEDDFSQDESDYTDDTGTEMTSDDDDDDDVKKPKIKVGKKRTGSPGKSIKAKVTLILIK